MAKILCPDCDGTGWLLDNNKVSRYGKARPCLRPDCIAGGGYVEDTEERQDKQPSWQGSVETVTVSTPMSEEERQALQAQWGDPRWGF